MAHSAYFVNIGNSWLANIGRYVWRFRFTLKFFTALAQSRSTLPRTSITSGCGEIAVLGLKVWAQFEVVTCIKLESSAVIQTAQIKLLNSCCNLLNHFWAEIIHIKLLLLSIKLVIILKNL